MSSTSGGDDGSKMQDDKGGEISLKKGPWTQVEDAILIEYIEKHGEGNWNSVQKNSGLARCAKSCRHRWAKHLKPDLKKGAFTKEEEQQIVELHAIMGNKWSQIAAKLPGRTDNEIKNFWETRTKRMQLAGLTTYLDETEIYRQQVSNGDQENLNPNVALTNEAGQQDSVSQTYLDQTEIYGQQVSNGDQENLNPNVALTNEAGQHDNVSQTPDAEFRRLTVPPCLYDPSLYMPMPPVTGMLQQLEQCTYSSQYNMLLMPMMHPSKRLRGSDMICNSLDPSAVPGLDQYGTSDPYNLTGSHADLNGNISASSDPIYGDFKVELPSLQYFEARKGIWATSEPSLPPLLEAADTPESSILFQPSQTGTVSHQNNDSLLESVIYGSNNLNGSNNVDSFQDNNVDSFQENNDHCVVNEVVQYSTLNPSETQWDEQEELRSSLGPYAASVLADYTNTTPHDDKHGTLTEFPADSPSPESQNLLAVLLDPDPATDLSFLDKNGGA